LVQQCGNKTLALMGGILDSIWLVSERQWVVSSPPFTPSSNRANVLKGLECHEEICRLIDAGKDMEVAQVVADHIVVGRHLSKSIDLTEPVDAQAVRISRE
jgi:hypothetical protein